MSLFLGVIGLAIGLFYLVCARTWAPEARAAYRTWGLALCALGLTAIAPELASPWLRWAGTGLCAVAPARLALLWLNRPFVDPAWVRLYIS